MKYIKGLPVILRYVLIIAVILFLASSIYFVSSEHSPNGIEKNAPTTFAELGLISFRDSIPYFIYKEEGKPSLSIKLIFNNDSICAAANGSALCIALSTTFDMAFNNKQAVIEGIEIGENQLVIKKLLVITDTETNPFIPKIGIIYIPWQQARSLVQDCGVTSLNRSYDLNINLILKDKTSVTTVQPTTDEMLGVVALSKNKCKVTY